MTSMADEYERADREIDYRKHDFPPIDRLDVPVPPAVEIALLVRNPNVSLKSAADLIEQYARTRASEATAEAVLETGNRLIAAIDPRLARKEPV